MRRLECAFLSLTLVAGCASAPAAKQTSAQAVPFPVASNPYPSTYQPGKAAPTLIRGATVLTGTGERLEGADVLVVDGHIKAVGRGLDAPADALIVDGKDRWVTPGLIDVHSHLGVYPSPQVRGNSDGNEATGPVTANVWAEHSIWPEDPGFTTARIGGITAMQILPGSANLIGARWC
jgi:imidazolonepropionase-like amidohydrolase